MDARTTQLVHPVSSLKAARREQGLSRRDVAEYLRHKNTVLVCEWETRKRVPTLQNAILLARLLKRPIEQIFDDVRDDVIAKQLASLPRVNEGAASTGAGGVSKNIVRAGRYIDTAIQR